MTIGRLRRNGTLALAGDRFVLAPDGQRMKVIRPKHPEVALAIAKVALEKDDVELFKRLPDEVGDYDFVGYLGCVGGVYVVVDEDLKKVDVLKGGDSYVTDKVLG